jgi:hypothetical protein
MEKCIKNMIETNFIPSEHPYAAIYNKGRLGLLIGTLLEVIEETDGSVVRIPHPVVTGYAAKEKKKIKRIYAPGEFIDTDIWWDVSTKDVFVIGIEGGSIDWDEFLEEIAPLIKKKSEESPIEQIEYHTDIRYFYQSLDHFNIKIEMPKEEFEYDAYLFTEVKDGLRWCMTDKLDTIKISCLWEGRDEDDVYNELLRQLSFYGALGVYINRFGSINLIAADEDEDINASLTRITEKFNAVQKERGLILCCGNPYFDTHKNLVSDEEDYDGIKSRTRAIFNAMEEDYQKDFLKDAVGLLRTQYIRENGKPQFFNDAKDWIGVYLTITEDLGLSLAKNQFHTYANEITPENFTEKARISNRTMTNYTAYTNKEKNHGYYSSIMKVREAFWSIVVNLANY